MLTLMQLLTQNGWMDDGDGDRGNMLLTTNILEMMLRAVVTTTRTLTKQFVRISMLCTHCKVCHVNYCECSHVTHTMPLVVRSIHHYICQVLLCNGQSWMCCCP